MLHAVIMAGGAGTRFWPASRRSRPKQLLALAGDLPLLRLTRDRLDGLVPAERVWVVTTAATVAAVRELLPELPAGNVIAEPAGRNTAACAGLAAVAVRDRDPDAVCAMLPADHLIGDAVRFRSALAAGGRWVAREGGLLAFGIRPTRPETGYGYLEIGAEAARDDGWAVHQLASFVEKPDAARAAALIDAGRFLWNAGIFAWRARDLRLEIARHLPDLDAGLRRIAAAWGTAAQAAVMEEVYPQLPATSVDYGIMERGGRGWVVPVDFPWSDIGSWPTLGDELPADHGGNATRGRVQVLDATGNVLVGAGPVVAAIGVHDLVVVATPDAVLVVPRDQAQRVKEMVEMLAARGWDDVL